MVKALALKDGRRLAYIHLEGNLPGIVFLPGLRSDMMGAKARALEQFCAENRRSFTCFDYTGHGASSGDFEQGTVGDWTNDALAVIDHATKGPIILVGSSMGGWIMLLAALARQDRVKGLVGIAAAPDFTEDLMWQPATPAERSALARTGRWERPSAYSDKPYVITQRLIEEGRRHLVLRGPIALHCPVHLLHGQRDPDVPYETSLRLAASLISNDVTVELIKAGDHRLSSPADLDRLRQAIERVLASVDRVV